MSIERAAVLVSRTTSGGTLDPTGAIGSGGVIFLDY
jgi:hypothetical protein